MYTRSRIGAIVTALGVATAVFAVPVAADAQAAPGDVYVSPHGSDRAPGTSRAPVRTLTKARDMVRARTPRQRTDLTVHLASGVYRLARPLVLDGRDSGTGGHRVVWQGSDGTVVSGGRRVTGWRPVSGTAGLWSAPAPTGLDDTRQLYVNGSRAQRARGQLPVTLKATPTGYTASADTVAHWRNPAGIEMVYTGGDGLWSNWYGLGPWTEARCPVAAAAGTAITMAQPCWDNSTRRPPDLGHPTRSIHEVGPGDLHAGRQPNYVENAFELLDQPGEWYLDRGARQIYYRPRPGEDPRRADVEAPALEKLVDATGIRDVTFAGLRFSYATWLRPSGGEGLSEIQATVSLTGPGAYDTQGLCGEISGGTCPFGAWTKAPGNVSVQYGQRVSFLDDEFSHLGAAGLDLGNGSQYAVVRGCVFTDVSGNGLQVGDVDKPTTTVADEVTHHTEVADNHFHDLPVEFHGGVAVFAGYVQDSRISHNQIDHVGYSGISIGWGGWLDKVKKPAQPNISHGNVLSDNLIFDHMLVLSDGAGIYTNGNTGTSLADGERITGNVIHDQRGPGNGIYTDNGAGNITITGNVLYHNYADWAGRHADHSTGGTDYVPLDIEYNHWQLGEPDAAARKVTVAHNQLIAGPRKAPKSIVDNAGLEPAYRHLLTRRSDPPATPSAADRVAALGADTAAYVAWTAPVARGGAPITGYTVTSSDGRRVTVSAAEYDRLGYVRVPGLANGTPYTFTVTARNANGAGQVSTATAPVTPAADAARLPGPPTAVATLTGDGVVSVSFQPPADTGGAPVLSYTVTADNGVTTAVTGRAVLLKKKVYAVFDGLTNGVPYTFTVTATTAAGTGPAANSAPATPAGA